MKYDVLILGGGLAGGLIAYRLHRARPEINFLLLEGEEKLGGTHTWCFYSSDLTPFDQQWISPLVCRSWPRYDVKFPKLSRQLETPYNSVESGKFHEVIAKALGERVRLNCQIASTDRCGAELSSGERIEARLVIDARGWKTDNSKLGYQKFLGQRLQFDGPHGLSHPVVMDATIDQIDGYRFFYLLPWSETELMIEDTHYSDTPEVAAEIYRAEIKSYCEQKAWKISKTNYEEWGSLPIPMSGKSPSQLDGIVYAGMAGGYFHATTGYSFPYAVQLANEVAKVDLNKKDIAQDFHRRALSHWRSQSYFRMLNRMLFQGAVPSERYRILERFYGLGSGLIERFYAGKFYLRDRVRLLWGRPPIPIHRALSCLRESA